MSTMLLLLTSTARASGFRRAPLQVGHILAA